MNYGRKKSLEYLNQMFWLENVLHLFILVRREFNLSHYERIQIFEFLNISVAVSIIFLLIFLIIYFEVHVTHIAISLNKSQSTFILFTTCHFLELYKNNYFGIILLNCYYVFIFSVFLNRDILFINTIVHICGLYKIAR